MSRRRGFWVAALVVTLLIAGVGSYYASAHPDGLEYVAEKTGFLDSADDSPTADSPFADYGTEGVDDPRVSGGIAGVVGVLVTLALAGGIAWVVRRRGSGLDTPSPSGSGYSTNDRGYSTNDRGYSTDDRGYSTDDRGYSSGDRGYSTDDRGYSTDDRGYSTDDRGYSSGDRAETTDA